MAHLLTNQMESLRSSAQFQQAKKMLIDSVADASKKVHQIKSSDSSKELRERYQSQIKQLEKDRGRDLYYPFLASGLGSGPFVELLDGSVKYDMITGIGIHFFGHSHPQLIEEIVDGLAADVMQGNLEPGVEMKQLLELLIQKAQVGSRLQHAWLMCSGTMVNEVALKVIRQKKFPATKVFAIQDCFAGRSTAMQEITDNASYRVGQPIYGEVSYVPFYDARRGLSESIEGSLKVIREELVRYPGKYAALMLELVQGEGGFQFAPREYYVALFEEVKKNGLAVWIDEIQTFGRTGELFAFQKFCLGEYVDVVTVGKMLQACAVLFTEDYKPKPGLVAGTFSGSTVALRTARRILELLDQGKYLGSEGRIEKLSQRFRSRLEELKLGLCKGMIGEIRVIGGMVGFVPLDGSMESVKSVLMKLYDLGVVAFYCGHGPYLIRMLPPLGVMTDEQVDEVCHYIEKSITGLAQENQEMRNK